MMMNSFTITVHWMDHPRAAPQTGVAV